MNDQRSNLKFDLLAVLLVLCLFSVTILSLLLTGANSYRSLTQRDAEVQDEQIVSIFFANKLRQAVSSSHVLDMTEDDTNVLYILDDTLDETGRPYVTRVYYHDGWLREIYSDQDYKFSKDDGEKIARIEGLTFSKDQLGDDALLTIRFMMNGKEHTDHYALEDIREIIVHFQSEGGLDQ